MIKLVYLVCAHFKRVLNVNTCELLCSRTYLGQVCQGENPGHLNKEYNLLFYGHLSKLCSESNQHSDRLI